MNDEFERVCDFAQRIGVPVKRVSRKFGHPKCPSFPAKFGITGDRITMIIASPELEHFMRTNPRSNLRKSAKSADNK